MANRRRGLPDSKALLADLVSEEIVRFGIRLRIGPDGVRLAGYPSECYGNQRAAVKAWIFKNPRWYGSYCFRRDMVPNGRWRLMDSAGSQVASWVVRPTRQEIAAAIRRARALDHKPSYRRPDTLGWRGWYWNTRDNCLVSPAQHTHWLDPELRVPHWSESSAVRGAAGIHACRLPKGDWRKARAPADLMGSHVIGLVERFGKFILGAEGWRAEWVFIRELLAPDEPTARAIRRAYPDIPVSVAHESHWLRRQ